MYNFELTIKKFFDSVYALGEKRLAAAVDAHHKAEIQKSILDVKSVEKLVNKLLEAHNQESELYRNRQVYELSYMISGHDFNTDMFIEPKKSYIDNSTFLAYRNVVVEIANYYQSVVGGEERLLKALKGWNYKISTNKLKDFYFPFLSLEHFLVKEK